MTVFVCVLAAAGIANGQSLLDSLTTDLNIRGLATTMDPETGVVTVTGDVHILYGDVEMRSGSAQYNQTTGEVVARDGVTIWKAGTIYRGDSITYNSITGEMSGHNVISGMPAGSSGMSASGTSSGTPKSAGMVFFKAEDFHSESKLANRIDATGVSFTSHDVQNPNFRMGSKELTVYPGDKAVLRDVKLYAGDTPFFWLPKVTKSLNDDSGYRFSPGYQSRWGAFLLTQYAVQHGDHTFAKYKFDLRSKRGVGGGVDFISMRHRGNMQNFGVLKLYAVSDNAVSTNLAGSTRFPVNQTRYRANFQHRIYLPGPDVSTWYLDFDLNKISDIHFYEDFFFNDFRTDREPDNLVSLIHTNDAYVATLMAKFKMNDFYRTTTRLPELSFDFVRRPLFGSGIFHQGTITAGVYNEVVGRQEQDELLRLQILGAGGLGVVLADPLGTAPASYLSLVGRPRNSALTGTDVAQGLGVIGSRLQEPDFTRFHTYHELLYPKTYLGWLNVTPRIGFGMTSYGSIDGSTTGLTSFTRGILHLGLDVSFKLTKTWSDTQVPSFGINGIRHVFQPYLNYSYLDATQNAGLPAIDRLSPTTRPRSIDVLTFTAVDSLRSWNVARLGFRNLLQTKRDYTTSNGNGNGSFLGTLEGGDSQTYTWAGMNTYVDVFGKDPEFTRSLSNLYNEVFWRPVPWITLKSDLQLPIGSGVGSFTEANNGIIWLPTRNTSFEVGHQHISDHPFFQDSSLLYTRVYARLTDNYGFNMNHIYEGSDGTLQFQSYSLSRDLSSWVASIGVMARDNQGGAADFGILLSFTLKDFPQLNFDLDVDPNPTGRGGKQ
ncbi:MAG: LPS assembly protein LptD [Prosthecobacter sp.]|uniref:LPS assembly protein LptD n=1 Tax=Prosthecobacter sp. TaxID=1965333 RepID=UPI0039041691